MHQSQSMSNHKRKLLCEDGTVQINIESTTIDSYQWESSNNGVDWDILIDDEFYSGVDSNTLTINNTPTNLDNFK